MPIIVKKYGGTSLDGPERIGRVCARLIEAQRSGYDVVAVVSAPGQMTSQLLAQATDFGEDLPKRELDVLLAVGEQFSIALLTMALVQMGSRAIALTGPQAGIVTSAEYGRARILEVHTGRILKELATGSIVVVAGFQGITPQGEITTLGRGGSDTTAVALAAALGAESCEVWTDVDGVFTSHPGIVPEAPLIPRLSFEEMLEMAEGGARVLKPSAVEMARRLGIEIGVGSSYSNRLGSSVGRHGLNRDRVTGISLEEEIVLLTLHGSDTESNFALINTLAARGVNVLSIWERGEECGLFVGEQDLVQACSIIGRHAETADLTTDHDLALLSVVGSGIGFGTDVMTRALEVFKEMYIRPAHYFFTEMRISFAVKACSGREALVRLHEVLIANTNQHSLEETA